MSLSLVNYSSSSESEIEETFHKPNNVKRLKLESPNLSKVKHIIRNEFEHEDLKEQHEGRIRSFDHERGNWATFLYIPVSFQLLEDIQESIKKLLKGINLVPATDIHISMTKTVILRYHWIESFVISIKNCLSDINKFKINFGDIKIYCNEENTRTFIGLSVNSLFIKKLKHITDKIDLILDDYKLETFYNNPSFHMSILWCLGDHREFLSFNLLKIQSIVNEFLSRDPKEFELYVDKLLCKIGFKSYSFDLFNDNSVS